MWRKINAETKIGGLFGIVALLATFMEVALNGFTATAIAGGVKDFAGTMVAVAVLWVAVKSLLPPKKPTDFDSALNEALEKWGERATPLVHKAIDYDDKIRYYLLTNMEKIFTANEDELKEIAEKGAKNSGTFNGKFFDLVVGVNPSMSFFLNASTFRERAKSRVKSYEDTLMLLASQISDNINKNFGDFCKATSSKDAVTIKFIKRLTTIDDAERLVNLIEHVLTLYTIAC